MDVSKYLKFACGPSAIPNWQRLLDRDMLIAFLEKCKRFKLEADGQIRKLDSLEAALSFIRRRMLKDDPSNRTFQQSTRISDSIKGWKTALRKEKTKRRMQRMEELSSSTLSLDEVDDVIQDKAMWRDFVDVSDKLGDNLPVSKREMNACTIMVATLLTFRSWQRPGAVANATIAEYKKRTEVRREGETVTIIKVAEHKTGLFGSAKLVIPPDDLSKLHTYVTTIRPCLDPQKTCPFLLCLAGGEQLTNFNSRFKTLAKTYGLKPLTATEVRKRASTEAAKNLGTPEAALVTRQLSHSAQTDARFYQALSGPSHAAEAFISLNRMRQERKHPDPPTSTPVSSAEVSSKQVNPSPKKRVPFSPEEMIKLYFKDHLKSKSTPSLAECTTFLANHPLKRNAKQVQDS